MTNTPRYEKALIVRDFAADFRSASIFGINSETAAQFKQDLKKIDPAFQNDALNERAWTYLKGLCTQRGCQSSDIILTGKEGEKIQAVADAILYVDTLPYGDDQKYNAFKNSLIQTSPLTENQITDLAYSITDPKIALGSPATPLDDITLVDLADMAIAGANAGVAVFSSGYLRVDLTSEDRDTATLSACAKQAGGFDRLIMKLVNANNTGKSATENNKKLALDLMLMSRMGDTLFDAEEQRSALQYALNYLARDADGADWIVATLLEEAAMPSFAPTNKAVRLEACYSALEIASKDDLVADQIRSKDAYKTLNTTLREQLAEDNNRPGLSSLNNLLNRIDQSQLR